MLLLSKQFTITTFVLQVIVPWTPARTPNNGLEWSMNPKFRCSCPITSALDLFGDKWTLVLVKQMLIEHKKTFKDFMESDESISTNILSAKLTHLVDNGLVEKANHPSNKKTKLYLLTDKGLSLAPIILELACWADQQLRQDNPTMGLMPECEQIKADKTAFIKKLEASYRENVSSERARQSENTA